MARQTKRRKFSNNQPVVIRFGTRKLIGKVVFIRPVGKQFTYDVLCEDQKVYPELGVDTALNLCIDTYLTKLFYQKYKIDPNLIPEIDNSVLTPEPGTLTQSVLEDSDELTEEATSEVDDDILFQDEDLDPNY